MTNVNVSIEGEKYSSIDEKNGPLTSSGFSDPIECRFWCLAQFL